MKPENKKNLGDTIRLCDVCTIVLAVFACMWLVFAKESQIGMACIMAGFMLCLISGKIRRVLKSEQE